jgi:PAS domain S-box-containing protein
MKDTHSHPKSDILDDLQKRNGLLEEENKVLQEEIKSMRQLCEVALLDIQTQQENERRYEESQLQFRTIFEQSNLGNEIISADQRIVKANKALTEMLGYTQEELIGMKITEFLDPEFLPEWLDLQEKLWKGEMPSFNLQIRLIKKDRSTLWCNVNNILFQNEGSFLGFSTLEDITDRKVLEEKFLNSESMLLESQKAAGVGSFIIDLTSGMIQCSAALKKIFDFEEDEKLISKEAFLARIEPNSRQKHEKILAKAIEQNVSYASEYKIIIGSSEKWIWEKGKISKDAIGNVRITGVAQANDSETLLLLLGIINGSVNTVTVMKCERDENGKIIDFRYLLFNTTAKRYMKVPDDSEDMIGKTLTELFPATRKNGNFERYVDTIENKKRYKGVEYYYPHEGMKHWFSESGYCFGDCIIITLEDITDRKNKEEELKKLAIRNDDLDAFVYTASHDLLSPVNNVQNLIWLLASEIDTEKQNDNVVSYIELLNRTITHLKNTISDLTTVTEIHPGEMKEPVNLASLIEEVKTSLSGQIEEAQAKVVVDLKFPFLTIPRKHAQSLIYNLLCNALKFRDRERNLVVKISSTLKDNKTHLSVEDNGIGIKEVDQDKIFMIFRRFNPEIAGRGVGTFLVKRVIDLNNGNIYLESKENEGTTFHIEFPVLEIEGLNASGC